MASNEGYAHWILDAKSTVSRTKDWKGFLSDLQDAIDHQLSKSHVPSFNDLTPSERLLFIERAAKSIEDGASYSSLYSQVSLVLDQQVNNIAAKELLSQHHGETKTKLVLNNIREGAVCLLKKNPEMKVKLHMCLNMPIPVQVQSVAWSLFLSNSTVRKDYLDHLMRTQKNAASIQDKTISDKVEKILQIQNTFPDLAAPCVGAYFAMKAVLSYFHAQLRTKQDLHHIYYLLLLPMIQVMSQYINKTQPAANSVVTVLMEMYIVFHKELPPYVADTYDDHEAEVRTFSEKVAYYLLEFERKDNERREEPEHFTAFLTSLNEYPTSTGSPTAPSSTTTPSQSQKGLADVLVHPIKPLIKSLFVGFLSKDVLMFVWDQYMIGLDVTGYHNYFLPAFTATLFMLLREKLCQCESLEAVVATVQRDSRNVNVYQIQQKIKEWCFKSLYSELNQDQKAAVPVIDPTKATDRNWYHWNNELIPARVGPQVRHDARAKRLNERDRLVQQRQEEELRARAELVNQHSLGSIHRLISLMEQRLAEAADREARVKADERDRLVRELEEERLRNDRKNRDYDIELLRLREEIELLRRRKSPNLITPSRRFPSGHSIGTLISAVAPPPTRASFFLPPARLNPPTPLPEPTPRPRPIPKRTPAAVVDPNAEEIITDLVSIIARKFNKLSHGDSHDKQDLNEVTREDIDEHRDDVKYAELQLFGRYLQPGEFQAIPADEQGQKSDEMMDIIRIRLEDRREQMLSLQSQATK